MARWGRRVVCSKGLGGRHVQRIHDQPNVIPESSLERSSDCAGPRLARLPLLAAATTAPARTAFVISALPINCSAKRMDVSMSAVSRLLEEPCGACGVA
jgi:hypothetical protein